MPVSVLSSLWATQTLLPAAIKLPCESKTPFGTPVVPLVYIKSPVVWAVGRRKSGTFMGVMPLPTQRGPSSISMLTILGLIRGASGIAAKASSTNVRQSSAQRINSVFEWESTKPRVFTPATRLRGVARNPPTTVPKNAKLAAAPFAAAIATEAPSERPAPCK